MTKGYLAIDTSNYTTSCAIYRAGGITEQKRLLPVPSGHVGLRQSDAVFSHIKALGELMEQLRTEDDLPISAIGVSSRPRDVAGSYMPCFLAGKAAAEIFAAGLDVPVLPFSHQDGHIMAALYSSGAEHLMKGRFAAFHVSGGTTELLEVNGDGIGFKANLIGGTKDLNAGQVIDRIGVHLGMTFPAGPQLEKAALEYKGKIPRKKVSVKGTYANLSGLENMAIKLYNETCDRSLVAAFVFDFLGESILAMCKGYSSDDNNVPFVFAGGVMCNSIIKGRLSEGLNAYFADPLMSADNAVGIARLATLKYISDEKKH